METLARTVLLGLAACSVALLWRKSSLLAERRAVIEARGGLKAELSRCPLCLATNLSVVWLGLGIAIGLDLLWPWLSDRVLMLLASPAIAFGVLQHIEGRMNDDET